MPEISIFNTLTRLTEVFSPLTPGKVSIYHCGPTVYHFQHIGHMRRFIFADLVHRIFALNHYEIKQIINITDVGHLVSDEDEGEDKMEKGAKREGKSAEEIAEKYTKDFLEDLRLLHISTKNTIFPKATEHIPEQISLIKTLEEKGFTYQTSDGIYFDTSKDSKYGSLAKLDILGLKEGARVEKNPEKKNSTDFALWKFSKPGDTRQQEWESPWGVGFPGWHIECSAMVKKFLGETIDIHTGGIDHIPVHHTNEIAQSENANEVPLAHYWMHNEHVDFRNKKIAKSDGNFIRLKDLMEKGYPPLSYRYFTLLAHYRTKINFTFEGLDSALIAWKRLNAFVAKTDEGEESLKHIDAAISAFNDDLNTPRVIAVIWEMMKDTSLSDRDKKTTLVEINEMIGILDPHYVSEESISLDSLSDDIKTLIDERQKARENMDWNKADEIRNILKEKGYDIEDGSTGVSIRKA